MVHNKGLHTFFNMVGYCMKDINDGHFQFVHHNVNGELIESWWWKIACASHISMLWSMQWCLINTRWKGGLIILLLGSYYIWFKHANCTPLLVGYRSISQCQNGLSNIKILVKMHSSMHPVDLGDITNVYFTNILFLSPRFMKLEGRNYLII